MLAQSIFYYYENKAKQLQEGKSSENAIRFAICHLPFAKLLKIDVKSFIFIFFLLSINFVQAQTQSAFFEQWTHEGGEQQFYLSAKSITDENRNVYVAGATLSDYGDYDMLLTKYDHHGNELWSSTYNGDFQGNDYPLDLKLDHQNNLFVTGSAQNGFNLETDYEAILLKIKPNGDIEWVRTLDDGQYGPNVGTTLDCDAEGNVYFAGAIFGSSSLDYFISKYKSSGQHIWTTTYDYQNLYDGALKIKSHGSYLIVSGISQSYTGQNDLRWEIATLRLTAMDGQILSASRTGGSDEGMNTLTDLEVDDNGSIYLCGSVHNIETGLDMKIAKLDEDLNIEWIREYNGSADGKDEAESLILDENGNVYVTGYVTNLNGHKDIMTLKLSASGYIVWEKQYDGGYNNEDEGVSITLIDNEPVVAATSYIISNTDYLLLHYNSSGILQNKINFNGPFNGDDIAIGIAADLNGDVLVIGQSQVDDEKFNYTTVKYSISDYIDPWHSQTSLSTKYIMPNRGQLLKTNFEPAYEVNFINDKDYPNSYIQRNKISYVFTKSDITSSEKFNSAHADTSVNWVVTDSVCRIDMEFTNSSNQKFQPISSNRYYESYFLSYFDSKRVQSNNKAIAFDVWRNVDAIVANEEHGLGIGFICNPGFITSQIAWTYNGADSIVVNDNSGLLIYSPLGILSYEFNEAFQVDNNGQELSLSWVPSLQIVNGLIKLTLGGFDTTIPLVLTLRKTGITTDNGRDNSDNLEWSTFYGGSDQESFYDVASDINGNAFVVGNSISSNFPVTPGVVQFTHAMDLDIVVAKFNNSTLTNEWATYYGGSGVDRGYGIDIDYQNNVIATGFSSSSNFPIENEIQPNGFSGNAAIFKIDPTGSMRIWASQFGPYDFTAANNVAVDGDGNAYVVGRSYGDIPIYTQDGTTSYTSGRGFILKISPAGAPLWSTRYGHHTYSTVNSIAIDINNNKYITGASRDPAPQMNTNPNYSGVYGGGSSDAFIAKLDPFDNLLWGSWYGGYGIEEGEGIAVNSNADKVVIVGGTMSTSGLPLLNPLNQNSSFGGYSGSSPISGTDHWGDGFIAEFSADGTHLFGSYFGGLHVDACLSVDYDDSDQIFLSGVTVSSSDTWLTSTQGNIPDLFQQGSFNGVGDGFIAALNQNRQLIWGTYFGGGYGDVVYGITTAANNKLYIAGWTESLGAPENPSFPLKDPDGTDDYFEGQLNLINDFGGETGDGFIARFNIQPLSLVVSTKTLSPFKDEITIQPNPNNGNFIINRELEGVVKISIFSLDGKKVFEDKRGDLGQLHQISVPNLQSGVYILTMITKKNSYYGKFSKL